VASWRLSTLTGAVGVIASAMWFMAMTIQLVACVRTLSLTELVFTFLFSWFYIKERAQLREIVGVALLPVGIVMTLSLR
jgi:uncharacterized membrane protein